MITYGISNSMLSLNGRHFIGSSLLSQLWTTTWIPDYMNKITPLIHIFWIRPWVNAKLKRTPSPLIYFWTPPWLHAKLFCVCIINQTFVAARQTQYISNTPTWHWLYCLVHHAHIHHLLFFFCQFTV